METFGEWLQQQRGQRRLTRVELAKRIGCSVSALRKIEDGERRPSAQIAELMANCLDVPLEERSTFVRVARGELNAERLHSEIPPLSNTDRASPLTNLPVFPSPLIGREREVEQVCQLLRDPQCRLLTLVGPGGSGKTRLAIEAASRMQDVFANGLYFVSLAPVSATSFIVPMIADALGFRFQGVSGADPKTQLFGYLREKRVLLLADNLEQLLSGPGIEVLTELLADAPEVKLLVTSRESLGLQGEWIFEVQGLPVPENSQTEGFAQDTSVELFLQRARRARVGFHASSEEFRAILRICQLVDGMPLAIELAAAWVRTLTCAEIAREIERSLDFLSLSARDIPVRHRSMRAVFDHSWDLLSDDEQSVLSRLSIFKGGFSLEAAEQIASATVFTLSNLVTKSLIRRSGNERFDLHELLRQYAKSRAQADLEQYAAIEDHHSAYYLNLVRSLEQPLIGPQQVSARAQFVANMENIRTAWEHAVSHDQVEIIKSSINGFWNFFETHTWYHEGVAIFGLAADEIQRSCGAVSQMDSAHLILYEYLRCCQGWCCIHVGRSEEARSILEEGVQTLRVRGAVAELTRSLHYLGVIYWQAGEYTKALELFHEKRVLDLPGGMSWNLGLAHGNLGMVYETMGLLEDAREHHQHGISIFRAVADVRLLGIALFYLGGVENKLGLIQEGKAHLYESLEICRSIGDRFGISMACNSLGLVLQTEEKSLEAEDMFQEGLNVSSEMGEPWIMQQSLLNLGFSKFTRGEAAQAQACFLRALRLASAMNLIPCILDSLAGMACIYAGQGKEEIAMNLAMQVERHPAVTQTTKLRAGNLRGELETHFAPAQIATIQDHGGARTLEAVVEELLS